jgi:VCBS repeat-containing protein
MGDLLADNDGGSLVQIIMVLEDGEELLIADMTDFTTAFAATAAAGGDGTATVTPSKRFDLVNDRDFGDVAGESLRPEDNLSPFAASADISGDLPTDLDPDVRPANVAPQITTGLNNFTIDEDNSQTFTVSAIDPDGSVVSIVPVAPNGTAIYNEADGTITYTPNENYNGEDTITIVVSDNVGGSSTKTINVTVNPINDAPIIDETHTVTLQESDLVDLTTGILSVIATNDTNAAGIPVYGFEVDTSHSQVVTLLSKLGEATLTAMITDALQAIAFDATGQAIPFSLITVNVDITETNVTMDASVVGLPLNPFAQTAVLDTIRDTVFDNLGENFQLPFENGAYLGNLNLVDVDSNNPEHAVTAVNYDPTTLSLDITTTDSRLIAIVEQLNGAEANTSFIKELIKDYLDNGTPSATATEETRTIDGKALALLISSGLFMLEVNADGTYVIASPLFNMMSETDTLTVNFDYTAVDALGLTDSGTAAVTINGENDAPIALDSTDEVMLVSNETSVSETLPGSYGLNTIKDLIDTVDTNNGTEGILDTDVLTTEIQNTVTIDVNLDNKDELVDDLSIFLLNTTTGASFSDADGEFLQDAASNITTLGTDISNEVQGVIEAKTTEANVISVTKQSFIDIFGANEPVITFDQTLLNNALDTYIRSNDTQADKDTFEQSLSDSIYSIDGVGNRTDNENDVLRYIRDNETSVIEPLTEDSFDDAESDITKEITDAAKVEMKNVIEDALGDLTGADDTALETSIENYLNARMDFENEVAGATEPSIDTLKLDIVNLYLETTLDQATLDRVVDVADALGNVTINTSSFDTVSAESMLEDVLSELGLSSVDANSLINDLLPDAQAELKDFAKEIDLADLLVNKAGVHENVKGLLDTMMGLVSDTIDGVFTTPDGREITNTLLENTIDDVVSETLEDALASTMNSIISELRANTDVSETILSTLEADVNEFLIDKIITDDAISFDVDTMKSTALNNMIEQLNLSEFGLLDKTSRDALADNVIDDLFTRLSMDEDITDLADLEYVLVEGSVETIVTDENGNAVRFNSPTTVTIDEEGSYIIENDAFSTLNATDNVEVKFDYQTTDGIATSEAKTTTVNIDLEDHLDPTITSDEFADLLETAPGIDSASMDSSHILSGRDLADYVAMTDEDNTLRVYGDESDTLELNAADWQKDDTPYNDGEGFNVYTATYVSPNAEDQVIKLLIEDKVNVEL